jgi:hypothetical protein
LVPLKGSLVSVDVTVYVTLVVARLVVDELIVTVRVLSVTCAVLGLTAIVSEYVHALGFVQAATSNVTAPVPSL